jgi:hypothetical protein
MTPHDAIIDPGRSTWEGDTLRLTVDRTGTDLRIWEQRREPGSTYPPVEDLPPTERYSASVEAVVRWSVRCADRPMVVRPEHALTMLPDTRIIIYVALPVWIGVATADVPFFERPTRVVRNTWFGATPQAGELAYAATTAARTDPDTILHAPGRAVSAIELVNGQPGAWPIERLKVPARYLRLFQGAAGLWTPMIRVRNAPGDDVAMDVLSDPPALAGEGAWIAPARDVGVPQLSLSALGGLRWRG